MADPSARRFAEYLSQERRAAALYTALARLTDGSRADALNELAAIEDRHAAHWEERLRQAGAQVPAPDPHLDPDSATILARARALSLDAVLPELEAAERDAQRVYDDEPDAAPGMADDERIHEQVLARLRAEPAHAGASSPTPTRPATS